MANEVVEGAFFPVMNGGMRIDVETESESTATANATVTITITKTLVKRVSERVAKGVPLKLALAGEPVTLEQYEEQLSQHPELAILQDVAKREILEDALTTLFSGKSASPNIRWWLTTVYPEIFDKREPEKEEPVKQTIRGVPEEEVERWRAAARLL